MLERDLKIHAMQLVIQLPDDEITARKVHALMGQLIDNWIFSPSNGINYSLPGKLADELIKDTKFIGNEEILPR